MALGLFAKLRGAPSPEKHSGGDNRNQASPASAAAAPRSARSLAERLIREGRYAILLDPEATAAVDEPAREAARKVLEEKMALVPAGQITVGRASELETDWQSRPRSVFVPAFYLDRYAVSNADFAEFVAAGGYDNMELWPQEIWPSVLRFVDENGAPGPRFWSHGRPPRGKEDHPVVGVCWHEACAYARWVGKRLPSTVEWEKAGSWPADLTGGGPVTRYPWGNVFEPERANLWSSGREDTVPVQSYGCGCTFNGVYQLVGNVWEWVADRFEGPPVKPGMRVYFEEPMREIRGGAFDTYFETEATCQFRTGQPELDRRINLGFRCALSADRLQENLA